MSGRRRRDWFRFCAAWRRIGKAHARRVLGSAAMREHALIERHRLEEFPGRVVEQLVERGKLAGLQILGAPEGWRPLEGTPKTRGDCPTEKPCRHVCCKHNLMWIDAADRPGTRRATHRLPLPIVRWSSGCSCALDFVDANPDGAICDTIGALMGVTGERVLQNLDVAFSKISASGFDARGWADALAHERLSRGRKTK